MTGNCTTQQTQMNRACISVIEEEFQHISFPRTESKLRPAWCNTHTHTLARPLDEFSCTDGCSKLGQREKRRRRIQRCLLNQDSVFASIACALKALSWFTDRNMLQSEGIN